MANKISLDDVIAQLRNTSMERVVEAGRIKGGLTQQAQEGCHVPVDASAKSLA